MFLSVGDFEFTPECVIFDLLGIKLHHGWLVDPQSTEYKAAIGNLGHNQLVEKIVASKEDNNDSQLSSEGTFRSCFMNCYSLNKLALLIVFWFNILQGLLAESFLAETANQLTYHGVCELNAKLMTTSNCAFSSELITLVHCTSIRYILKCAQPKIYAAYSCNFTFSS